MKLVYVANARLPTEKAHGYQISKMCEAFARGGANVELLHPARLNASAQGPLAIFEYYEVAQIFAVRTLPNLDIAPVEAFLPARVFVLLFFVHALAWGLLAAIVARRARADLYYTRDLPVAVWLTALGLPTAYEAHTVPKHGQLGLLRRIAARPQLKLVVSITSFIRDGLVEAGVPLERTIVLPDAVDLEMFEDLPTREACREALGLPLNRPIIGYVGRFQTLELEKGIPDLIRAMGLLPVFDGAEPLLLCVGGPMEPVQLYLELARSTGVSPDRLEFRDRVPHGRVPLVIKALDIATMPWPRTEHLAYFASPLKLFEYLASGVPMLATDLPSVREIVSHGRTAWLVQPDSPQGLADGLCTLLRSPELCRELGSNARDLCKSFTWNARAAAIIARLAVAK